MKIHSIRCIIALCGISLLAAASEQVEYLKLNRKNVPNAQTIIAACEKNLRFDTISSETQHRKARLSALMPIAKIGYSLSENSVPHYDKVDQYSYRTGYDTNPNSPSYGDPSYNQQSSRFTATGFDNVTTYDAYLEWNLENLIMNPYEVSIETAKVTQEDQVHFLVNDIAKHYAELWRALPEHADTKLSTAAALKVVEKAGILDAMSGGAITEFLMETEAPAPVVTGNGPALEKEIQQIKTNLETGKILEVSDGQDDTVEKIGEEE
ncbi:hypothetical protein [Tichowtungia aerotolerans]|uniref:Uncharacterized protein n=1 Tax=Tichowtungia aerotolerans TaxID=2697043 RepID=A0A6P1M9E3_9BACT|nr:hypothetical protein [Tichowtungia aerotolerans]QHI69174.1 hypothetical protein GT409_06820 [Tichowtungia aerotolerans]